HPVAQAIAAGAVERGARVGEAREFTMAPGAGVEGVVGAARVRIGTSGWLAAAGISTAPLDAMADQLAARGRTPSFVAIDGELAGVVAIADRPAAEATRVIAELEAMGIEVAMVTGDRERTARAVA